MTDDAQSNGPEADAASPTPSARWLEAVLWAETPPTDHLKKRALAQLPQHLIDNLVEVEEISVLGVPQGARVDNATETGMGVWRLDADAPKDQLSVLPPDDEGGVLGLTIKVVGKEEVDGASVAAMGGVRLEMPAVRRRSLFRHLPDMQWAAAKAEEDAAKAEEEAAARAAEEAAAAAQAAAEPDPEPEPAPDPEPEPEPAPEPEPEPEAESEPEPPKRSQATIVWNRPEDSKPDSGPPKEQKVEAEQSAAAPEPTDSVDPPPNIPVPKPEPEAAAEPETGTADPTDASEAGQRADDPDGPAPKTSSEPDRPTETEETTSAEPEPEAVEAPAPAAIPAATIAGTPVAEVDGGALTGDSDDAMATGLIRLRLGGAPEVGDPHYRILVDGKQIAAGNIDWVLGMAAADDAADGTCWQDRIIPWNFDNRYPDRVSVRYEGADGAEGALLMEYAEINGLRIDTEGPYVFCPEGRIPWAGSGERRSWRGELVVNVAGARAGDPDVMETPKPAGRTGGENSMQRPLIIRPSSEDLANPEIMTGFAVLRQFLRSDGKTDTTALPPDLANLELDPTAWNDLVVMGPDGEPVTLEDAGPFDPSVPSSPAHRSGDTPRALVIRPDAEDLSNPHIVAGFRAMRRFLQSRGDVAEGLPLELRDEALDLGLFDDLVVIGPDGGPADLDAPTAAAARPFVIRPTAQDLANPAVIAEFALLRRYLRSDPTDDDPDQPWPEFLGQLGFERREWSDVIVIDPAGVVVELGGFDTEEDAESTAFSPQEVEAAMARLVADEPDGDGAGDGKDAAPRDEDADPPPAKSLGRSIKETFLSGILARMPGRRDADDETPVSVSPKTPDDGRALQQTFLDSAVDRGLTRIEDGFSADAFLAEGDSVDAETQPDDLSVLELGPDMEMPPSEPANDMETAPEGPVDAEATADAPEAGEAIGSVPVYLTLDTPLEEPIDEDDEAYIPPPPVVRDIPEFLTHLAPAVASIPTKPPEPEPEPGPEPEIAIEVEPEPGEDANVSPVVDAIQSEPSASEEPVQVEEPTQVSPPTLEGDPDALVTQANPGVDASDLSDALLVKPELPPLPDPEPLAGLNRSAGQVIQRDFLTGHLRLTLEHLEMARRNRRGEPTPISQETGRQISDDFLETVLAQAIAAKERGGGIRPT